MTEIDSTRVSEAMRIAGEMANSFGFDDDDRADAISIAWEFVVRKHKGEAKSIAWNAIRTVRCRRLFCRSKRSVEHPQHGLQRWSIDFDDLTRNGENPADVAILRIDFDAFRRIFPKKKRRALDMMIRGESTLSIAKHLQISNTRVSQYRRQIFEAWQEFVE